MCECKCHEHHEHQRVVLYMRGDHPRAVPDEVCARRGDKISFIASGADFRLWDMEDMFTVSIEGNFKVSQNSHLDLVVRDDVPYDVYSYAFEPLGVGPMAKHDPTIIIHPDDY